jgi:hypothetical protein
MARRSPRAKGITGVDWQQFADEWRRLRAVDEPGAHPRIAVDQSRRLAPHGARHIAEKFGVTGLSEEDKIWFNLTWHRLGSHGPIQCRRA